MFWLLRCATHFLLTGEIIQNLREKKPFSLIADHELDILIDAINDKAHTCDEWCSDFICYKYVGETCDVIHCHNLFFGKNTKYCSWCRYESWPIYENNYLIKNVLGVF